MVAAGFAVVLASTDDLATHRSLVFAGGPWVLLAGLHVRLGDYLHATDRARLAVLPISASRHFAAAWWVHRQGLALACGAGLLACGIGAMSAIPGVAGLWRAGWLGLDFVWLCILAAVVEPVIPAVAAYGGRRFPDSDPVARLQRQWSGGWTTPEATVHLYAPALGLATAVALALPGQLALALAASGKVGAAGVAVALGGPLIVAVGLRVVSPRMYAQGFFEAVAWLSEATRRLAGPPEPLPAPRWLALFAPHTRLLLLQWWRLHPVLSVRLAALLGYAAYLVSASSRPSGAVVALGLAVVTWWCVPLQTIARHRRRNAAYLSALPVPAGVRAGASPGLRATIVGLPVVLAMAFALRWWLV